jgi:hypothetical protein
MIAESGFIHKSSGGLPGSMSGLIGLIPLAGQKFI